MFIGPALAFRAAVATKTLDDMERGYFFVGHFLFFWSIILVEWAWRSLDVIFQRKVRAGQGAVAANGRPG